MKCNITFHGILDDFMSSLTPKVRSAILRDVIYHSLFEGDRAKLSAILLKYESRARVQKLLALLPDSHSPHTPSKQKEAVIEKVVEKKIAPAPKAQYQEEGEASLDEVYNEFDMTK